MPKDEIQNPKQCRFVVLLHEGHGKTHYDLLLEVPGQEKLMAWHISHSDISKKEYLAGMLACRSAPAGAKAEVQRIADHRKIYMEYEGEISGGRGTVKRVAEGLATVLEITAKEMKVRLEGGEAGEGAYEMVLPLQN